MERALEILLINAASAAVLAACVGLVSRWIRNPAVMHVLWLLVLVKLLAPPVIEIAILPDLTPVGQTVTTGGAALAADADPTVSSTAATSAGEPATVVPALPGLPAIAGIAWLGGSLLLLALTVSRTLRFRRLVRGARLAGGGLRRQAERLAARLGLGSCPPLRVVGARVPPMLRPRLGPCEVLLPSRLVSRLEEQEREALLAHELAHLRRRDHWVRFIELVAAILFWWNPVVGWVRRRLRAAEEKSCDVLVLETLPGGSRAYADGLVKTLDFLARGGPPVSALTTGAGETRQIEERLTMIMRGTTPVRTTTIQRVAIAALAVAALLVFPTWMKATAGDDGEAVAKQAEQRDRLMELELRAAELERELREVRARQMEIERSMQQDRALVRAEEAYRRAVTLESEGRRVEAEAVRADAEPLARRARIEAERARADADDERVREREERARELARTHAELGVYADRRVLERERDRIVDEIERLERSLERSGLSAGIESYGRELERMEAELRASEQQLDEARHRLRAELTALAEQHAQLREQGRPAEAERLEPQLEQLKLRLYEIESGGLREHERLAKRLQEAAERMRAGSDAGNLELDRSSAELERLYEQLRRLDDELERRGAR